jgi:DNA-binding NarL/FixJ family response regulator
MSQAIRVALADDHEVVRAGVRDILETAADVVVVGEAADGQRAVELALRLHLDVMVMDVQMPRMNGIEATRRIRSEAPSVRVLVLSAFDDPPYIRAVREAGAQGYVLKTAEEAAILRAVRSTAQGAPVLESVLHHVLNAHRGDALSHPGLVRSARVRCTPAGGRRLDEQVDLGASGELASDSAGISAVRICQIGRAHPDGSGNSSVACGSCVCPIGRMSASTVAQDC